MVGMVEETSYDDKMKAMVRGFNLILKCLNLFTIYTIWVRIGTNTCHLTFHFATEVCILPTLHGSTN